MRGTVLAVGLLAALLVACGGGSKNSKSAAGDASNPSGNQPANSSSQSSNNGQSQADLFRSSVTAQNCPALVSFITGYFAGGAFGGGSGSPGQFDASFFQNAAKNAPSEIKPDMQALADAFEKMNKVFQDFKVDFSKPATLASLSPAQQQQLATRLAEIDTPALQKASDNVTAYLEKAC
jgi:hypothetical protein